MLAAAARSFALIAAFSCISCAPLVSGPPPRRVAPDTISIEALAKVATTPPVTKVALPAPRFRFETTRTTLREECHRDAEEQTNVAAQGARAYENDCLAQRLRMVRKDLYASARPDDERHARLMALEAQYDATALEVCSFSEDTNWVSFETGTRDWGSMMGWATLVCKERVTIERAHFAKTLAQGDVAGLVERITAVHAIGERQYATLVDHRLAAYALLDLPEADSVEYGPIPIDEFGKKELVRTTETITRTTRRLATDTCALFPALANAFGDAGRCETELNAYYFSLGRYDGSRGDSDDDDAMPADDD